MIMGVLDHPLVARYATRPKYSNTGFHIERIPILLWSDVADCQIEKRLEPFHSMGK